MLKINRLLQIIVLLINQNDITVKCLSERFGVSRKTIYRDLEALITSGIPVCYGHDSHGRISLLEGYSLKYALLQDRNNTVVMPTSITTSNTENLEHVIETYKQAWTSFNRHRHFDISSIKKEILHSWMRCQKNDVLLYELNLDNIVKPEEIENYLWDKTCGDFDNEHRVFNDIVKRLELDITIYDEKAHLKYILNNNVAYQDFYPEIGYFKDASEQILGTNSTCLALVEDRPFMVMGAEHYKNQFHNFSCVAAPIYKDKAIAGTINASFLHQSLTGDTLNIIYSLARLYERLILKDEVMIKPDNTDRKTIFAGVKRQDKITFDMLWGKSENWLLVKKVARVLSDLDCTVLICGEFGVGKKSLARCMHNESNRKNAPCIVFDCLSVPRRLVDVQLFGVKGKCASKESVGALERALGGTLVLENAHALPIEIQNKLYKFILDKNIKAVGSTKFGLFDVRLIICVNTSLKYSLETSFIIEAGRVRLNIPSLAERKKDIRILCRKKLKAFIETSDYREYHLRHVAKILDERTWEGNIVELFSVLDKFMRLASKKQGEGAFVDTINDILKPGSFT